MTLTLVILVSSNFQVLWFQVGGTAACILANRGFQVDIYESRAGGLDFNLDLCITPNLLFEKKRT